MTEFKGFKLILLVLLSMLICSCSSGQGRLGGADSKRSEQDNSGAISAHAFEQTEVGVWLSIQASSEKASANPQYASDAEKELANQRFLDTYKYPIPDYFPSSLGISNSQ